MHARLAILAVAGVLVAALPASADFRMERRLALEPGGRLTIDADSASIDVVGDSSSSGVVTITSGNDDVESRYDLQIDSTAREARVTVRRKGTWLSGFWEGGWRGLQITVHVPHATAATLRTRGGSLQVANLAGVVDGHSSGGSIRVHQVRGDVQVNTSGGSIDVGDVQGSLRAHTSGGSVRIDAVSGDITAETSGGTVNIRGAAGRVEAHSSGGTVNVGFAAGNNRGGDLSTSGGGVRADVDPKVALTIDASTSGGSVNSDVPVTVRGTISRRELRGDMNGGGAVLRLHTSGGSIRLGAMAPAVARR